MAKTPRRTRSVKDTAARLASETDMNIPRRREIERRAYFNFLGRRSEGRPGDALSDWIEAERQLGMTS